jgi:hypothetical protein
MSAIGRAGLAVLIGILLQTSTVRGELKGDPELLKLAAEAHRANLSRLVTWRGTVEVTDKPDNGDLRRYQVSFHCEKPRSYLRWHWAPQQGPEHVIDGLIREGQAYTLMHGVYKQRNGVKHAGLVIRPAKELGGMQRTGYHFDPVWYITSSCESAVDRRLDFVYKNAAHPENRWTVEREGDVITVEHAVAETTNRFEIDLSLCGNVVRAEYAEPGMKTTYEMSWQQVGGVWIPRTYSSVAPSLDYGRLTYWTRKMEWRDNVVNEAIAEQVFTRDSLPLVPGDRVTNRQTGESYTVE